MSAEEMAKIREMFVERLHVKKVEDSQTLQELGLDSLDVVELCLDLEDKYGITFSTEELGSFKTVGDLFNAIDKKLVAKK